jgi:upstream activation factor subunit UAF30
MTGGLVCGAGFVNPRKSTQGARAKRGYATGFLFQCLDEPAVGQQWCGAYDEGPPTGEPKTRRTGMATKASSGKGAKKVNPALMKPLKPSGQLAAIVGADPLPRPAVVSKVWEYIKKHKLQNPQNKREILADDKLEAVFGKKKVTMFEMNKHLAAHLK